MNLLISLIGLVCIIEVGLSQRRFPQVQQCYTLENDIGQCYTLNNCPSIANLVNIYPRNEAERYYRIAQRNCGNIRFRGNPVVCCGVNQELTAPTTTNNPVDPFFRTNGQECTTQESQTGVCTPISQCPSLITRLQTNPNDATFIRYLQISNSICKNEYAVVCCPNEKNQVTTPNPKNTNDIDNTNEVVIFPRNTNEIPTKLPTMADGCGFVDETYRQIIRIAIVGGKMTKIGAWPWIALIGYDDGISASPFKCGGALITSRHVLTAAHCIRSDLTFVRLGEHNLNIDTETTHVDVPVVKTVRHPRYNKTDGHNDIALLYLIQNVQFSAKITPICIPFEPKLRSKNIMGSNPFVAGWGRLMEGGKSSDTLQELQIPIFSNDECKALYTKQGKYISEQQFDNGVICAGELEGGKDTCQGDSGGPLMLPEDFENSKRYHLIGIVSYGIGCARPMIPGVYTRVTNYIEWIENGVANTP